MSRRCDNCNCWDHSSINTTAIYADLRFLKNIKSANCKLRNQETPEDNYCGRHIEREEEHYRPSMEMIMMKFAHVISQRSTCLERQVGAIICSPDYEDIYSMGYNGNSTGRKNGCDGIGYKGSCGCVHAEINAVTKCYTKDNNKVMFITLAPCVACAKTLANSRFSKIFYAKDWKKDDGIVVLREAGIEVIKLELEGF